MDFGCYEFLVTVVKSMYSVVSRLPQTTSCSKGLMLIKFGTTDSLNRKRNQKIGEIFIPGGDD